MSKLAEFVVAEGVVDDISHEGLRALLREEGVSFQAIKTFKVSNDPNYEAKKNRVLELYAIADGQASARTGRSDGGDLYGRVRPAQPAAPPRPPVGADRRRPGDIASPRRRRRRATYTRTQGVRHLLAAYDLVTDRIYGHVTLNKDRTDVPGLLRYMRAGSTRPTCASRSCWTTSAPTCPPRRTTRGVGRGANNIELAYVPFNASWLNRIECQFQALRYFALDGTDHRATKSRPDDPPLHRLAQPPRQQRNYVLSSTAQTLPDTALVAGRADG